MWSADAFAPAPSPSTPPCPEPPGDLPDRHRSSGALWLRFEDVSQCGRVGLTVLPNAYSGAMWGRLVGSHPAAVEARRQGIVPILHRLVLVNRPGPFSITHPVEARACFDLAHSLAPGGEVARVLLRVWGQLAAPLGSLAAPPVEGSPATLVGQAYAEHVYTRPFAPPDQRKVTSLALLPSLPAAPGPAVPQPPPAALLAPPSSSHPLDDALVVDDTITPFSFSHTDSNQHVNSLVYPRLVEEAALRRLAAHGLPSSLVACQLELAFRKPFFAGDRARVACSAFRMGELVGAVAAVFPDGITQVDASRAHCFARLFWAPVEVDRRSLQGAPTAPGLPGGA